MRKVLKRLEYINKEDVVTHKGWIAGLLYGADEILLTELIFMGTLANVDSKQLTVFLSLFINEEK